MKRIFIKTLVISTLFIFSFNKANSQIIESMGGALEGIGDVLGSSDADVIVDVFTTVLWDPTIGLFFGFAGEPAPRAIDFARYPYEWDRAGMYQPFGEPGFAVRGEFTAHYQNNGDALQGAFFQLKVSPWQFLTFEANHLNLFEDVEKESQADRLAITNFNVQYNRIRHHVFHGWWGGGLMHIRNEDVDYISPTFTAGTTIYFKRPLSLYADIQTGFPNGVAAIQSQARMQIHLERFKIYGGYQALRIGDVYEPSWSVGTGVHF